MAPRLVFGAAGIGESKGVYSDEWETPEEAVELYSALQRLGVTELDSAAGYPPGHAWSTETVLGQSEAAKKGFTIDSKIIHRKDAPTLSKENINKSVTKTLNLIGADKLRTLYAHGPDPLTPIADQAANFHEQYLAGTFDRLGLCNYSATQLEEYFAVCDEKGYIKPAVYQGCYNALYRFPEKDLIPLLRRHNCVFFAFSPLAGGFLTGKVTSSTDNANPVMLERTRWRGEGTLALYVTTFDKPIMHEAIRKLKAACEASSPKLSVQEAALRWVIHHSALQDGDAIIIGAKRMVQLESNVADARRGPLEGAVLEAVESLWVLVSSDVEEVNSDK
ncbi:Aldo-keto reductase [Cladobotryum mycophilum]|uniref:Aldo-keto reductase n=1 Tax=Cladobotryum mycophilum TaxID=491253 RepID=A0ABR0SR33_9HYPO